MVEGTSGGGSVVVKMDGRKQVLSIKIDPEAVKSGDVEMLQDLVDGGDQRRQPKGGRGDAVDHGRNAGRDGDSRNVEIV